MRKFNPWPYQQRMIQFALQHPRCGLFVPMGMGKTSASLAIIDVLKNIFEEGPALVIAPLAVARNSVSVVVERMYD